MTFLVVDRMHDSLLPMLEEIGVTYDYQPDISKEEIKEIIKDYDGIIVRSKIFIDNELLSNANKLKYVCRAGAGIDNLDIEAIQSKGIQIINAPEGNRNALAEHTLGLLLALLNKVVESDKQVRNGVWDREGNRGTELAGKSVGVIGYGYMGSAFVEKLKHLNCRILVYDKDKTGYGDEIIEESSMEELFCEVDILSIHVPLTQETHQMINKEYLSKFKKPIRLINTSRGKILPLTDLIELIEKRKIIAAALDVLENEKINTFTAADQKNYDYLINSDQVILTPHVGGWSFESYEMINKVLIDKLRISIG